MNTKDSIQKELQEISTTVAEMSNGNAFKAPENYFENFAATILQKAKSFGEIETPLEYSKINHFEVSENYFENFANKIVAIAKANQADNELNLSSKINHFAAPENYFEQLPDKILVQTKLIGEEENDLGYSKINHFSVTENYFENLADTILAQTKLIGEEEEALEYSKINHFEAPANFFENNAAQILAIVKNESKEKGKIISWFNQTTFKFAAAASVAAFLVGVAIFTNQPKSVDSAPLTAQEIKAYLQNNSEDVDELQMTETPVTKAVSAPTKAEKEKKQLKEYLENEVDESSVNDAI